MDKARILPADAAGHLSHGRRFGLFRFDVRHVRRPVHHSLDSHSHGTDTAAETRNARRKSDCILHTADLRRGRLGHAALPEAPAVGIGLGGYRLWAGTHPALPAQSGSILHRTGRRHRSHRMFRRHHSRPVQRRTGRRTDGTGKLLRPRGHYARSLCRTDAAGDTDTPRPPRILPAQGTLRLENQPDISARHIGHLDGTRGLPLGRHHAQCRQTARRRPQTRIRNRGVRRLLRLVPAHARPAR